MSEQDQFTLHQGDSHYLSKAESAASSDKDHEDSAHEARGDVINEKDVGSEKAQQSLEKLKTDGSEESERDPRLVR